MRLEKIQKWAIFRAIVTSLRADLPFPKHESHMSERRYDRKIAKYGRSRCPVDLFMRQRGYWFTNTDHRLYRVGNAYVFSLVSNPSLLDYDVKNKKNRP